MSKKIQIILIVWLSWALCLGSWTIFFGKWSVLTTNIHRHTVQNKVITKNTVNILHSSYKWLQWTQRSPNRTNQLEEILHDRVQ